MSTLIHGFILLFVMVLGTVAYQTENDTARHIRVAALLALVFSYEPILTSRLCTVGQYLVSIRVRQRSDHKRKISVVAAYFRTIVKVFLGVYSLFAMGFNRERRAAHDFAVGSIVLDVSEAQE